MTTPRSSRRDFLKSSAIAGAAASLAGIPEARAADANSGEPGAVTLPSGIVLKPGLGVTRPRPEDKCPFTI